MAKTKRPKPIYVKWVKWLDHYSHRDGWGDADYSKCHDGLECESVGFLMGESKKSIHLSIKYSHREDSKSQSSDSMTILKSCIIKRKYLK